MSDTKNTNINRNQFGGTLNDKKLPIKIKIITKILNADIPNAVIRSILTNFSNILYLFNSYSFLLHLTHKRPSRFNSTYLPYFSIIFRASNPCGTTME